MRAARASDAPGLARIQVESWRSSLDGLVPAEVLAELGSSEASEQFAERWRDAIVNPPTSKHRVHVAVDPDTEGSGVPGGPGGGASAGTGGGASAGTGGGASAGTGGGASAGTGGGASAGTGGLPPVGFASAGPATDDDKWPATDAELYELHVLPSADAAGHGARLLHAVADTLAEDGFQTVCAWVLSDDAPRLEFLESAGWAPDGAHSNLDMGVKVHLVRLHARLS